MVEIRKTASMCGNAGMWLERILMILTWNIGEINYEYGKYGNIED